MSRLEFVRDPLWNNIRLEPDALELLDSPAVQRLRYVRQLGHAFLVYPGATHTRFEHALGAYHLARRALSLLQESGHHVDAADAAMLRSAALLHDIGHYPFSHALEEAGLTPHEILAERHLTRSDLAGTLERRGIPPAKLLALIRGQTREPLAGLVAGSLDVDKLDYLSRDAWMCGVPYGVIDVERLLSALTLARTPGGGGRVTLALHEKGLAALESLLFAKYQMYRNVYWHHAVRAATAMFKRLVRRAIREERIQPQAVATATDDGLIHELSRDDPTGLARALAERRLAKRVLDLPATDLPPATASWPGTDPELVEQVEDRLAVEIGLAPGDVFLDFPVKEGMLAVDLPLVRRDGAVRQLAGPQGEVDLGLPRVATELYRSARRLRVFTLRPARIPAADVIALVQWPREEVATRLAQDRPLLSAADRAPASPASSRRRPETRRNRSGPRSP